MFEKIAIYGLSTETLKAIPNLAKQYEIIGLMDSFRTEGMLNDYPIISLEEAISRNIVRIIVVARPGSCKVIAKRIGEVCKNNNIDLFDIRGNDLLAEKKVSFDFCAFEGIYKAELLEKIEKADVISFDFFDTLVTRKVFSVDDVFELCNTADSFAQNRIKAEKELSRNHVPNIYEIYDYMGLQKEDANKEFETDKKLLIARQAMVEILEICLKGKKRVFITSDTYYTSEQIREIMISCDMDFDVEILASCETGKSKTTGLFEILKDKANTDAILHIGDDLLADEEYASKAGIETYRIYSGVELYDMVGGFGLNETVITLTDRIKIGLFIAKMFNDPFQFEENKKVTISDAKNIGYLFFAPMICDFSLWLDARLEEEGIKNIWLSARDGYLIQKLFSVFSKKDTTYFYTSRTAAIRIGVEDEEDIKYVDSMKYSGTIEECLYIRFGIEKPSIINEDSDGLLKYKNDILCKTALNRAGFFKYLQQLDMDNGEIAFFDFVAKGTTHLFVSKLVENKMKGFYFLQLEPEFMKKKKLDIEPFFDESERETSSIFDNYYILETILTAPHASVNGYDADGKPIFAKETRNDKDIECVLSVQDGILEYLTDLINIIPIKSTMINKKLDEEMLNMIKKISILSKDFLSLVIEDPFFNRRTDIVDVM